MDRPDHILGGDHRATISRQRELIAMRCILRTVTNASLLLFVLLVLAKSTNVNADTFQIRDGGTISGTILNDPTSAVLKIRTNDGIVLEIAGNKIKRVPVSAEVEQVYKSLGSKEDTAELHRAMSLDLNRDHKYLSIAHKERVVELEPSDENWGSLGYFKDPKTGEWVSRDFIHKRKGLMYEGKKWDTPESRAIDDAKKKLDLEVANINRLIEQHLNNLSDGGPKGQKAIEFFNNLNDKLAIKKIYEKLLKDSNPGRSEMYMRILAGMPGNSACGVFAEIAMNTPNEIMRGQAIELLERTEASREFAFNYFLSVIGNSKSTPAFVDRAGSNIQSFVDKRAIPTLISRLITKVTKTQTVQAPNTFSKDGGSSLSTGPQKYETQYDHRHQSVLSALLALVDDGTNFQYEIPRWREWYAYKFAKSNLDLRRDE